MADEIVPTGLTEIDGKAVSSVSYKREVSDEKVSYQLIFRQGNKQVARLNELSAEQVVAALGEENGKAVHWSTEPKGLLKGKTLHYAQGVSPALVESVSDAAAADRVADAISKTYAPTPAAADAGLVIDVPGIDQRDDTQNEQAREIRARQDANDLRHDDGEVESKRVASQDDVPPVEENDAAEGGNEVDEDKEADQAAESEDEEAARAREAARAAALAEVEKSFYHVENKYYHRDNKNRVAFIEGDSRLRTAESDAYVARSMVKVAEAKGWDSIKVTGTDEFRRAVWMEAALRGLQVRGYKPKDVDLAELAEKQESRLRNSVEQGDGPEKGRTGPSQDGVRSEKPSPQDGAREQQQPKDEPGLVGTVLSHGAAKFDFKPDEKLSYYVRLQTAAGEKIVWGVDLPRALEEGQVKEGDRIRLENLGRQAVQVTANVRDEAGKVVGQETITSHRNKWQATHVLDRERVHAALSHAATAAIGAHEAAPAGTKAASPSPAPETGLPKAKVDLQQTKAAAAAFRQNIDPKAWTAVAEQHPQLKNAYAHLAMFKKFAEERLPESHREAFLQRQVQNIASDVEAGRQIGSIKIVASPLQARAQSQDRGQER